MAQVNVTLSLGARKLLKHVATPVQRQQGVHRLPIEIMYAT